MDKKEDFIDVIRKKMGLVICICLGVFFLFEHFVNPRITEEKKLITLNVVLEDYTFEQHENDRRYPTYYLKTSQYKNFFKVVSGDVWLFKMDQFESDSLKNKPIHIKISSEEKVDLDQTDRIISLYGISKADKVYLDSEKILRENQGPVSLMLSFGFFGLAGFLVVLLKKKL